MGEQPANAVKAAEEKLHDEQLDWEDFCADKAELEEPVDESDRWVNIQRWVIEDLLDAARTEGRGGEPVAWRVKDFADGWILCHTEAEARREAEGAGNLTQPLYALAVREPEISREADWESAEQAARLINPEAWAEKDRRDASAFKGGYSAYLSKRLDESRKLARAILNLAPVAKGVSHDADLSDEFDRPGRLSDATRHSAEGTAYPALSGARGVGEGWRPIPAASPIREPEISKEALIETMRQHIKADAVGLAPAVIAHCLVGFEEAADAILNLAPVAESARIYLQGMEDAQPPAKSPGQRLWECYAMEAGLHSASWRLTSRTGQDKWERIASAYDAGKP